MGNDSTLWFQIYLGDPTTTNDYLTNPYYNETTAVSSQVKHIYSYGNITSEYINSPDNTFLPWVMSSSTWNLKEIYNPNFPKDKVSFSYAKSERQYNRENNNYFYNQSEPDEISQSKIMGYTVRGQAQYSN